MADPVARIMSYGCTSSAHAVELGAMNRIARPTLPLPQLTLAVLALAICSPLYSEEPTPNPCNDLSVALAKARIDGEPEDRLTARQAALDSCESAERFRREREQFEKEVEQKRIQFVPADIDVLRTQLTRTRSARAAFEDGAKTRAEHLIAPESPDQASLLEVEQLGEPHHRRALEVEEALLAMRLDIAARSLGASIQTNSTVSTTATTTEISTDVQAVAANKTRLARDLDARARENLASAKSRLNKIQSMLDQSSLDEESRRRFLAEREYWQAVEKFEQRRLNEVERQLQSAQVKQDISRLLERVQSAKDELVNLHERDLSQITNRVEDAKGYDKKAMDARAQAERHEENASTLAKEIPPLQKLLASLGAREIAIDERAADHAVGLDPVNIARMRALLESERHQIDPMIMVTEILVYSQWRLASLERELAGTYSECSKALLPSFLKQHLEILQALLIVLGVVTLNMLVNFLIFLAQPVLAFLRRALGSDRFSAQRATTLIGFAGSIVNLFLWIVGFVWVFDVFGINPAQSAGAIGLVGLMMAGFFQQIVLDFVKGLDIIAGRHYNLGDYIAVAATHGHVIGLNVKYTRLRTLSGQEINLPNSQCVPSRRFPDGYVNNYVDFLLKSANDEGKALALLTSVSYGLNQRIEPVREPPDFVRSFDGLGNRRILRYRVKILPDCGWVLTMHFIPEVKQALVSAGIILDAEPTINYINRIETFRKLFNRQLSEEEIVKRTISDREADALPDPELDTTPDSASSDENQVNIKPVEPHDD